MIQNRELTMDDYLSMLRRRAKVILIPALVAPLVGFLVSYFFTPKYTNTPTWLVVGLGVLVMLRASTAAPARFTP